ncbi:hypothetical protein L1887_12169 [Cichorium endivia]|nr:hypothetical protein L1887_12169 [Cichorium endivia]
MVLHLVLCGFSINMDGHAHLAPLEFENLIQNDLQNNSLQMASIEQKKKTDESVLRLVEEQKREKEEALKKLPESERQLDAKQKLEMEIEELKGNYK